MPLYDRTRFKAVLKNIQEGQTAPVYLLWGERYLYQSAYEKIVSALLPESCHSANLRLIDGDNADVYRLAEGLNTFPFFPGRQVFVVKDTRFLHSRATAHSILAKAHDHFKKGNLQSAARILIEAMALSGLTTEDVKEGGWGNISPEDWERIFAIPKDEADIPWLTEVTRFALQVGMDESSLVRGGVEVLENTLARGIPASNHLVLLTDAVDKRTSLYRMIEKTGVAVSFEVEKGTGAAAKSSRDSVLRDLLKGLLSRHGKAIETKAAVELMQRIGFNPASLAATVEKLANYAGEKVTITLEDVQTIVKREKEDPLYELTGALSRKDAERALLSLSRLLEQGYAPLQILASLTKHIRRLLLARWALENRLDLLGQKDLEFRRFQALLPELIKGGRLPGELQKVAAYPLFLLLKEARGFEIDHLIQCMSELLKVDIALKSGGGEARILLENLLLKCLIFDRALSDQSASPIPLFGGQAAG